MNYRTEDRKQTYEFGPPGKPLLICELAYPVFNGSGSFIVNRYITHIRAAVKRFCKSLLPQAEKRAAKGLDPVRLNVRYAIFDNDDDILSFCFDISRGRNPPHRFSSTWGVKNGFPLPLNHFLGTSRKGLLKSVLTQIEKHITSGNRIYYKDYKKQAAKFLSRDNFYIDGGNVIIFYQPGSLAPSMEGLQTFSFKPDGSIKTYKKHNEAELRNSVLHIVKAFRK